ncbi:site-specific integrase [Bacteroides gallinaceum]|uniref:Site-specific integrase n=3 Tax=Bacteroidales TaxID=171549 RepID=A0ABT7XAQ1_9BACE|nr:MULTISPECIES: site-specific integrase [Bacteroidaceae]MBU3853122.1 site-specific integrase [Candidatus Paraprevotella stercoravium]CCZ69069.1 integrase family protein [Bacteroides sp. CAG:702]MBD8039293.1 site-specific integrase [Phocaeicola intestinalis]MBM6660064.1 site-specific integrase [Bacteroides gallinaceum]MBM6944110.1 site-specific integrase [Bacteroides gallinaceum]
MKKISYRLVYNRKKRLNASGKALIQVEAYLTKQKAYFSTHIYVRPEEWDAKKARIVLHPQEEALNRMLDEFLLKLQYAELEGWKRGKEISLSMLKTDNEAEERTDVFAFGRKWVEHSKSKESTKNNLSTTFALLHEFRPALCFAEMDYSLLLQFEHFLEKKKLKINTIAKHMRHLRTLCNEAIRQGVMLSSASPFIKYRIKTTESKHVFLLPEELRKLEELPLGQTGKALRHTLDAFLFCCYTGIRYSDFIELREENIVYPDKQHAWLTFKSQKTGTETQVPLYLLFQGKALKILKRYPDKECFFRLRPNPDINKELVRLGKLAGIDKHFSFHSARHTNATLLIYNGAKLTTVQKLLGHRSIKTTQIYGEVFSQTLVNDLKKCKF